MVGRGAKRHDTRGKEQMGDDGVRVKVWREGRRMNYEAKRDVN